MTQFARWIAAAAVLAGPQVASAQTDIGRFIVTQVIINPALDSRQTHFYYDDPRFLGREVDFAKDRVTTDWGLGCAGAGRTVKRSTLGSIYGKGFPPGSDNPKRLSRLSQLGLPAANRPVALTYYKCTDGAWDGFSFSTVKGKHALSLDGEVILILTPTSELPTPKPSFTCGPGNSMAEAAICTDRSLTRWDVSMKTAYQWARYGARPELPVGFDQPGPREGVDVEGEQRAWLVERDKCGADKACLIESMHTRIDQLIFK